MSGLFTKKILPTLPNIPVINPKPKEETSPVKSEPQLAPLPPKDAKIIRYPRCNREMVIDYQNKWNSMIPRPQYLSQIKSSAALCLRGKEEYQKAAKVTGLPWELIAVIHKMEGNCDMKACLANGERIIGTGRKTTLVPRGKGPFNSFHESAIDSIGSESRRPIGFRWDVPNTLFYLEMYNGFGPRNKGYPSAYIWSYTNHYSKGKYIADGVWSAEAVSKQCGAAIILKELNWIPESWE